MSDEDVRNTPVTFKVSADFASLDGKQVVAVATEEEEEKVGVLLLADESTRGDAKYAIQLTAITLGVLRDAVGMGLVLAAVNALVKQEVDRAATFAAASEGN